MLTLFTAEAGSVTSPTVGVRTSERKEFRLVQVDISVAGTVSIQGRLGESFEWVEVTSFTASGGASISLYPQMQAVITGNTGVVDAAIDTYTIGG